MAVIYKLTREDGLGYIGITTNLGKRLSSHRRSKRFSELKIQSTDILFEGTYEECDALEEKYIQEHDTFKNGLNLTNKGKGKNDTDKFNTYGYKYSEESKKKMSESAKSRTDRPTGYSHSDETKKKWSELRKGKVWGPTKLDKDQIISDWNDYNPSLQDMQELISKTNNKDGKSYFKNGREFSYMKGKLVLFKRIKSKEYGVTPEAIKGIINDTIL